MNKYEDFALRMSELLFDMRSEDISGTSLTAFDDTIEIPEDYINKVLDDKKHCTAIKEQIRMSVLLSVQTDPRKYEKDDALDEDLSKLTTEELKLKKIKVEQELKNYNKKFKLYAYLMIAFISVVNFIVIFRLMTSIEVDIINRNFEKKINIIAPYTNDNTIKKLNSEWAQMTSKSDFNKIDSSIDSLFAKNNRGT